MRYNGDKIKALATGDVVIPRPAPMQPYAFTVRAVMYGDERKGERLFPDPEPPTEFKLNKSGKPLRDPATGQVITGPNFSSPQFVAASEHADRMQTAVLVIDALDQDSRISWETEAEPGSKKFYEDAADELKAAGFSLGDLKIILQKALELGNMDSKAVERAAEAFSQRDLINQQS